MEETTQVLEINLISAQGLKEPAANLRRLQTYALAWVDPSNKLRTRIDRIGFENPTWNDKFFFRVSTDFLSSDTSGVSIEIYAVGCLRDHLIGTVRFLISSFLPTADFKSPSFIALQIRRPSGRFQGVLNIGAMVIDGSDFAAKINDVSAIGFQDLVEEEEKALRRRIRRARKSRSAASAVSADYGSESSKENSVDLSDGPDSTASSPLPSSSPLKDWNGIRELAGKNHMRSSSDGGGLLGCFLMRSSGLCGAYQGKD